ncbi:protein scar1 [Phtheirospermum japonicum]|uniref:Protein SCAR n=1 Tax=Phtheirospermum japonicum TaxID=374723 RepID=A0A830BZH6_9LAMI|nr:protein scar1 [Phtheirospermum japonicum]
MPLVRVEVRNEYGLGAPEMYREANKDEPKEILEGVSVAGLVGVLRQLGDLADFAAEVFHGLQEEVMSTSTRSHKLMARVQRIENALSPLEKAILAKRSHLHFAYTAGSNWHTPVRCETNQFLYSDGPQFILDSYEECRDPPRLHMLDRFDPGGHGSCLKRYSDPSLFKRSSVASGEASTDEKQGPWLKNGEVSQAASLSYQSGRMQFTQFSVGGYTSSSQTMSNHDATPRLDLSAQSNLDVVRNGSGYNKDDFIPSHSMRPEEQESRDFIFNSPLKIHESDYHRDLPTFDSRETNLDDFEGETDHFMDALYTVGPQSETDVDCTRKQGIDDKLGTVIIDDRKNSPEPHKHAPEVSNVTSVTFWTNGGLLGLQPSKPPDLSWEDGKNVSSIHNRTKSSNNIEEGLDTYSSTYPEHLVNGVSFRMPSWKISPADLEVKFEKQGDLLYPNNENHQKTGYRRIKDLSGGVALKFSPPSSPPLMHMKISVQPIDGFVTSKLKLKFLDGNYTNDRSGGDIFPSFQLVPEATIAPHIVGLNSDDDVFCSSSNSLSDDCNIYRSESNSEEWENRESISTGSVQFSFVENGAQNSKSCRSFDLQSLIAVNHSAPRISQQAKPAPSYHDQNFLTTNELKSKSFNLRPIVPAKPIASLGGSSNIQATAILEKANAIRQAVGSDDGDKDGD